MSTPVSHTGAIVDRWFRALDQRPIRVGLQEWVLHITGILVEADEVWIQMTDGSRHGASVVLHVDSATPTDQAVRALSARIHDEATRPLIVSISARGDLRRPSAGTPKTVPEIATTLL